jgi:glucose/arabinose dehydrogenase
MALIGDDLYVADTDALVRYPYQPGQTQITAPGVKVVDLPAGPIDHHWTKNVIASADGRHLYVTVGSNSNVGENGIAAEAAAPPSGRSIRAPANIGFLHQAFATQWASAGSR